MSNKKRLFEIAKRARENESVAKAIVAEVERRNIGRDKETGRLMGEKPIESEDHIFGLGAIGAKAPLLRGIKYGLEALPAWGRAGLRVFRDLPAFELIDRLPTVVGGKRITELGGDTTQSIAERVVGHELSPDAAAISRIPGEILTGFIPGIAADRVVSSGARIGKAIAGLDTVAPSNFISSEGPAESGFTIKSPDVRNAGTNTDRVIAALDRYKPANYKFGEERYNLSGLRDKLISEGVSPEYLDDNQLRHLTEMRIQALDNAHTDAPSNYARRPAPGDPTNGWQTYYIMSPETTGNYAGSNVPNGAIGQIDKDYVNNLEHGVKGPGIGYVKNYTDNLGSGKHGKVYETGINTLLKEYNDIISGIQLESPQTTMHLWKKYNTSPLGDFGVWTPEGKEMTFGHPVVRIIGKPTFDVPLKYEDVFSAESISPEGIFGVDWSGDAFHGNGGSINIKPSKRGTFTAAATKHGKSVQAFASQVLANKENYSPAMIKKANFARNSRKWKHGDGGILDRLDSAYGGDKEKMLSAIRSVLKNEYGLGGHKDDDPNNFIGPALSDALKVRRDAVDDAVIRVKAVENSKDNPKGGWDKEKQVWYPHDSAEGGAQTIAYGIKLSNGTPEAALAAEQGYLTDEQVDALTYSSVRRYHNSARKVYDKKYGEGEWDKLSAKQQSILTDYEYNPGLREFPLFMQAVRNNDKNGMLKQYKRYLNKKELTGRNAYLRNEIEEMFETE